MRSLKLSTNIVATILKPHTNSHTVRVRRTLKDVERFRNRSVCELHERIFMSVKNESHCHHSNLNENNKLAVISTVFLFLYFSFADLDI